MIFAVLFIVFLRFKFRNILLREVAKTIPQERTAIKLIKGAFI